ncbi:putative kinesin group protein [Sordaria brevicollis]|uniref:Kinesin-like protein KIF22 n=1 Tax=Sordaria brevicollis TaxID=83679 RepID=A0AAE0PJU2_SORBR|nr:putative kinesin group protein [Sordaria brevicollis]
MSVRVVARIRPLLKKELDKDVIVRAAAAEEGKPFTIVKIPNPKNETEEFSYIFNSVYDQSCTQEDLFNAEVYPHIKALFQGLDVTIFAYGVTGTGKTHTMRGGMKMDDRGLIPRLLSNVFRRGKKIEKDSNGETIVDVHLSYYEIYNDKVYDLLEPPEMRTPMGLPLREKEGKTFVVGLTERPCDDVKDFERLYVEANNNRVTAATKLNAHSSRSHAILRVKVTQTTGDMVLESTASAIDLAGSEDNRRTDNNRDRLVESAAINKSLFVLSQCIDAISRGDKRIPYRESKMTRILSLGQNNGITIMILNLAPMRSYHLDTLSSLNVSSRAKRIEVREIENEVVYKQPHRSHSSTSFSGLTNGVLAPRQPLRPIGLGTSNSYTGSAPALARSATDRAAASGAVIEKAEKPSKLFNVYADRAGHKSAASFSGGGGGSGSRIVGPPQANTSQIRQPLSLSGLASRRSMTDTVTTSSSSSSPAETSAIRSGLIGTGASKLARPTGLPLPGSVSAGVSRQNSSSGSGGIQPPSSKTADNTPILTLSAAQIEAMVEKKVAEILAQRALAAAALAPSTPTAIPSTPKSENPPPHPSSSTSSEQKSEPQISEEVQRRLEALERRIEEQSMNSTSRSSSRRGRGYGSRDEKKSAGLQLLLEARKAKEGGDLETALGLYEDALGYFPGQRKLVGKIEKLRLKLGRVERGGWDGDKQLRGEEAGLRQNGGGGGKGQNGSGGREERRSGSVGSSSGSGRRTAMTVSTTDLDMDDEMAASDVEETPSEAEARRRRLLKSRGRSATLGVGLSRSRQQLYSNTTTDSSSEYDDRSPSHSDPEHPAQQEVGPSPRTKQLLDIVNSRDTNLIQSLNGFGTKRAQELVNHLDTRGVGGEGGQGRVQEVKSLGELTTVPGVGIKTVERAYEGLVAMDEEKREELSKKLALRSYYDETETF